MTTAQLKELRLSFVEGLPLTRTALDFALTRHAGQLRDGDQAPFVLHPLEVASLLSLAGYPDHVVASGVLHDVLENTHTDDDELEREFGSQVTAVVRRVSGDPSIDDDRARRSALRDQVAAGSDDAAAVFAADKVSRVRELRLRVGCGLALEDADDKLAHYRACLSLLEPMLGHQHMIVTQLRFELETLDVLSPR